MCLSHIHCSHLRTRRENNNNVETTNGSLNRANKINLAADWQKMSNVKNTTRFVSQLALLQFLFGLQTKFFFFQQWQRQLVTIRTQVWIHREFVKCPLNQAHNPWCSCGVAQLWFQDVIMHKIRFNFNDPLGQIRLLYECEAGQCWERNMQMFIKNKQGNSSISVGLQRINKHKKPYQLYCFTYEMTS